MDDSGIDGLAPDSRDAVRHELQSGETLLWVAEPSPQMQMAGCMTWIVAVPFVGFGVLWIAISATNILASHDPSGWHWLFALFGLPFLIVGLIAMAQPWKFRAQVRRTVYALTDRRLLRIVRGNPARVDEVPLGMIGSVGRQVYADGSGVLTVRTLSPEGPDGQRYASNYDLVGARDVEHGYRLLSARVGKST